MDQTPEISVIIPVYNTKAYLRRCVDSLIAQTMGQPEIILVDDGSSDGSGAICDEYAANYDWVKVIHQENKGLSAARNAGITASDSRYIMFADSDDTVEPGFCEIPYRMAFETGADIVMFGYRKCAGHGGTLKKEYPIPKTGCVNRQEAMMLIHREGGCAAWSKLYRRSLFDDIEFPEGFAYEDIGTTYRLVQKADVICCSKDILYNYCYKRSSNITGTRSMKNAADWYSMWSKKSTDLREWGYDISEYELRTALGFIARWGYVEGITDELAALIKGSKGMPGSFSTVQKAALSLYRRSPALFDLICRILVRHE